MRVWVFPNGRLLILDRTDLPVTVISCFTVFPHTVSQSYQIEFEHRLQEPSDSVLIRPGLHLQWLRLGYKLMFLHAICPSTSFCAQISGTPCRSRSELSQQEQKQLWGDQWKFMGARSDFEPEDFIHTRMHLGSSKGNPVVRTVLLPPASPFHHPSHPSEKINQYSPSFSEILPLECACSAFTRPWRRLQL